jgi:hypothetical protein
VIVADRSQQVQRIGESEVDQISIVQQGFDRNVVPFLASQQNGFDAVNGRFQATVQNATQMMQ